MLGWKYQICHFSLSGWLPYIYTCIVLLLDVVDEDFDQFLIFFGVRWTPLYKDGIFEFDNVTL